MQASHRMLLVALLLAALTGASALAMSGGLTQLTAPVNGPVDPSAAPEGWTRAKIYYGVDGSNDYRWGWVPPATVCDAWASWGTIPASLMDQMAAATNNHQYVIGGYSGSPATGMYRNDLISRTWTTLAPMPFSLCNSGAAWLGDTIYVFGGYSYSNNQCMDTCAKYSISGNSWTYMAGPEPGGGSGNGFGWQPNAVACGNAVYRLGGCQAPGATNPTNHVFKYVPGSGWTQCANMLQGRVFSHMWAFNDTIWVASGFGNGNQVVTRSCEFYAPATDIWASNQSIFPDLPADANNGIWAGGQGFCPPGAGVGIIYSGANAAFQLSSYIYEFSHENKVWTTLTSCPGTRYRGVGVGNAYLEGVFFGGSSGGFTPTSTVYYNTYESLIYPNDVGVAAIVDPAGSQLNPNSTVVPTIKVANYGTNDQPAVPVYFVVCSGTDTVYQQWDLFSVNAGDTITVQFADWQLPDSMWKSYSIDAYTDLATDQRRGNDHKLMMAIITTNEVYSYAGSAPSIDGYMATGEWNDAYFADITNAGGWGGGVPRGPTYVWFKHDANYCYFCFAMPQATTRSIGDQVGIYLDEDGDGMWPVSGTAEGNYWFLVNSSNADEVQYRYWTRTGPGAPASCPGADSKSSVFNGYLVFEGKIPRGTMPWELTIGEQAGLFMFALDDANKFYGWWPVDVDDQVGWSDPAYYGIYHLGALQSGNIKMAQIVRPSSGSVQVGDTLIPAGKWENTDSTEMNFTAYYFLDSAGTRVYSESQTATLAGGASVTLEFPSYTFGPDECPGWVAKCSTAAAGDQIASDNVSTREFNVTTAPPWPEGWVEVANLPGPAKDGGWLAMNTGDGLLYGGRGYKALDFYAYDPDANTWTTLPGIPAGAKPPHKGTNGVADGANLVYCHKGNKTFEFYAYDIAAATWTQLADVPGGTSGKPGKNSDLAYYDGFVYLLKGNKSDFARYNVATASWEALPDAPAGSKAKWDKGSWIVSDGNGLIYAHKGKYHEMFAFDVATQTWGTALSGMPFMGQLGKNKKSKDGGSAAFYDGAIYALKGGNTVEFWKYVTGTATWTELALMPEIGSTGKKKRVKAGGDLAGWGAGPAFFALKGNKTTEFWRYVEPAAPMSQPERGGVAAQPVALKGYGFALSPNPVRGLATLSYSVPTAGAARVTVLDVTGRDVMTRTLTASRTGTTSLDLTGLSAGVYLVKLESPNYTAATKLIVQ